MKTRILILIIVLLIGCNQKQNNEQKQNIKSVKEKTKTTLDNASQSENEYKFDNSIIPPNLIQFIDANYDSLKIPAESDYEIEYIKSNEYKSLPYFCCGNFNGDTLIDYAVVLIKDSTSHFVFSFHTVGDTYETYLINDRCAFTSEYDSKRDYAVFYLDTDTERIQHGYDTVYTLTTDAIAIANIYESRTRVRAWNEKTGKYDDLAFD